MTDLKYRSEDDIFHVIKTVEKYITSISVSNFRTNIPRVNFKKIKLNKFQNLFSSFKSANVTKFYLDEKLVELNLPARETKSESTFEQASIIPLRKKKTDDEKPPVIEVEENIQESPLPEQGQTSENPFSDLSNIVEEKPEDREEAEENIVAQSFVLKPKVAQTKDVTFNLEAQIIQDNENVLLSPTFPATPKNEGDIVSSSGKQTAFVWPPVSQKEIRKKTKSKKLKKKPYFLSTDTGSLEEKKEESKTVESKPRNTSNFPWALTQNNNPPIEEIFTGGLESELLGIPSYPEKNKEVEIKQQSNVLNVQAPEEVPAKVPFTGPIVYKALFPNVLFESLPENIINDSLKSIGWFTKLLDRFNNLEFGIVVTGKGEKKVGKMFEKFGYKLTPIRIIILGGAIATLGYSVWSYLLPIINSNYSGQVNNKVIVRNLLKSKSIHINNKELIGEKENKLQMSKLLEERTFTPITEDERLALIQMARESLENRLDPFGQEAVLPKEVIQQKLEEQKDTGPKEIPMLRRQVELVGIISANNKKLALVNVYNADYTITKEDDKATKDSKLKTALSMAVPNRLEVSLLDSVEEWYVKQIIKGKAKTDDPVVELVKGDKKFKLKVGQKVLLPEEKPLEEPKAEDEKDTSKE